MNGMSGKVILVTGGSSGIGFAAASRFAREGARVFVTARRQPELDAAVRRIGANAVGIQADAVDLADLDRLYATIAKTAGHLDVLFANVGGGQLAPLGAITEEHYDQVFNANVKATLFTVQKALPLMRNGGSIILMSSSSATMGTPALSVYSASKAAVRSLARSWVLDLQARRIRVNVLSPGPTRTGGLSGMVPGAQVERMLAAFSARIPAGRVAEPADVADAALFLASDESRYVNGIDLAVDGGFAQI